MKYNVNSLKKIVDTSRNNSLSKVSINECEDINNIKIDKRKNNLERVVEYIIKTKNPYFFSVDNRVVRISFINTDKTAEECLSKLLPKLYK